MHFALIVLLTIIIFFLSFIFFLMKIFDGYPTLKYTIVGLLLVASSVTWQIYAYKNMPVEEHGSYKIQTVEDGTKQIIVHNGQVVDITKTLGTIYNPKRTTIRVWKYSPTSKGVNFDNSSFNYSVIKHDKDIE